MLGIPPNTPEWHAARERMLTASDFAAALGIHPYVSRQKLWRLKTGQEVVEWTPDISRGVSNEQIAMEMYEVEVGVLLRPVGLVAHPDDPWAGATPDAAVGSDGLAEVKCPRAFRDAPPDYHVAQIQGQLAITGRAWCDYVQWVDGAITVQRVPADAGWWTRNRPALMEFWGYVERLEKPPRKSSRRARQEAAA